MGLTEKGARGCNGKSVIIVDGIRGVGYYYFIECWHRYPLAEKRCVSLEVCDFLLHRKGTRKFVTFYSTGEEKTLAVG